MTQALRTGNFQLSSPDVNRRYRWWHEAIIDDMMAFPLDSLRDRASRLGYSISYLSVLTNSDMFQLFYQKRKAEHSELLTTSLVEKTGAVAAKTLDMMLEQLETKRTAIPFGVLADTAQKSLAALGYGSKPAPAAVIVNNNQQTLVAPAVSREQLAEARNALLRSEQARVIDAPVTPLPFGTSALLASPMSQPQESVDATRLAPGNEQSGEG